MNLQCKSYCLKDYVGIIGLACHTEIKAYAG